ncbi:goF mRNA metabolism modulator [Aeromonas phage CC2]|uniref:Uncharacterized protein n=1 Tax=Aeromonas phage CC2 TaxID=1204516 RepID=I6WB75_9CAUD|nr:goF mRNA metabolism modulator [Aeromonas phage CC2]AFN39175.1 hypothetical protein CC2_027 [Aeromonas phage CC2]
MKIKFKDEQSRHEFRQLERFNKVIENHIGNEPHEVIPDGGDYFLSNGGELLRIDYCYAFIRESEMKYFDVIEDTAMSMDNIEALWKDVEEKKAAFDRSLELYHAEYNRMFR